jgi:hypothetical protein
MTEEIKPGLYWVKWRMSNLVGMETVSNWELVEIRCYLADSTFPAKEG